MKKAVHQLNSTKKKTKVRPVISLFFLAVGCFGVWLLYNVLKEINQTRELMVAIDASKIEYEAILYENEELTAQQSMLIDPGYVEQYARANYLMSKEDELIFYLPAKDN